MKSILTSVKKMLGIEEDYTHFDTDIIFHINSVLMSLNQLGIGPANGYFITSKVETWDVYLGSQVNVAAVRSYVFLKVRLLFDPPSSSYVLDAFDRQAKELEWRLNVQIEEPIVEEVEEDEDE